MWRLSTGYRLLNDSYRYSELVDLHAKNLRSELLSSDSKDIQERFNKMLKSFSDGEIPHAANAISALFDIIAFDGTSEVPPETNGANPEAKSKCTWTEDSNRDIPLHRKSMNTALIKSMHCGSLLDMEYRVMKQRIGADQSVSIYFSSTIFGGVRSKLDARKSPLSYALYFNQLLTVAHTFSSVDREGEQEVDDDSDYEEEPMSGFTEARTNDPSQEGRVPCNNFLPGALTT